MQHEDCYYDLMDDEIQELKKISGELEAINANTGSYISAFWRGILQGAGAIIGSILAAVLIGWILEVLGIIPGFGEIAAYFSSIAAHIQH
jgi:hypothetical protein